MLTACNVMICNLQNLNLNLNLNLYLYLNLLIGGQDHRGVLLRHTPTPNPEVILRAGAVFMFPKVLAAGAFSLRAGTDSCAMSISAVLHPDGSLQDPLISPSRVRCAQGPYLTAHHANRALCLSGRQWADCQGVLAVTCVTLWRSNYGWPLRG